MDLVLGNSKIHLEKLWNFQLFEVNDAKITLANLVLGVVFISVAVWISGFLTRQVSKKVLKKLDLPLDHRSTVESITYYVLLFFAVIFALNMANVPLTTFTLLGGAVAIGVGFGSQQVVNNFMSGIILMIEKPVKVGDIVELEGLRGVIEHIGARSTRIRSYTNTHWIVPNSSILQNNVLNWTLADDVVLISVSVGVAYGSDINRVKKLLEKVVHEEPNTLDHPKPEVLFENFGDNSLEFKVLFGVRMKNHMERMKLESRIRFAVDKTFAEHAITIAFPQRDVHLNSLSPIKVQVI